MGERNLTGKIEAIHHVDVVEELTIIITQTDLIGTEVLTATNQEEVVVGQTTAIIITPSLTGILTMTRAPEAVVEVLLVRPIIIITIRMAMLLLTKMRNPSLHRAINRIKMSRMQDREITISTTNEMNSRFREVVTEVAGKEPLAQLIIMTRTMHRLLSMKLKVLNHHKAVCRKMERRLKVKVSITRPTASPTTKGMDSITITINLPTREDLTTTGERMEGILTRMGSISCLTNHSMTPMASSLALMDSTRRGATTIILMFTTLPRGTTTPLKGVKGTTTVSISPESTESTPPRRSNRGMEATTTLITSTNAGIIETPDLLTKTAEPLEMEMTLS